VQATLQQMVGPTADLEDLVQTTFESALRDLHRFRGVASFRTWVTRIALHVAQHHLRAGRIRRSAPLELVPEAYVAAEPPDSNRRLALRRLAPRLHAALDQIHPRKRIALLLYVVEGRPVSEIASLTGASRTAVKSRLFFARRELRAILESDPELRELVDALLDEPRGEAAP
jgi:RNA polymerase sigma-70 factor (ECF subfamily)